MTLNTDGGIDLSRLVGVEGLNPWLMTAGVFADDPALEPMLR